MKKEVIGNGKGFRKAVIIFVDILGSQDREGFNEWYNIMRGYSARL